MTMNTALSSQQNAVSNGSLLLGAGLALASFIILPALATRVGLGPSLTGAMRIALMKASAKASRGAAATSQSTTPSR